MIDVGVNLLNGQFRPDLDDVLARARQAGLTHMIVTATTVADAEAAVALCARHDDLSCTAGVHPHLAKDVQAQWIEQLRRLAEHPAVRAIGETGLDFNRNYSPPDVQRQVFAAQVALAGELDMPLFVHDRDTDGAVLEVLSGYRGAPEQVLVHCFTGSEADLQHYLAAGYSIGVTGWVCDASRGAELRRLVPRIPLQRLVIETDAPFLFPHGATPPTQRRRRNEPCLLPAVAERLAGLYEEPVAELIRHTTENAQRLFRLPKTERDIEPYAHAGKERGIEGLKNTVERTVSTGDAD